MIVPTPQIHGVYMMYSAAKRATNEFVVGSMFFENVFVGSTCVTGHQKSRKMSVLEKLVEQKFDLHDAQIFLIKQDTYHRQGFWFPEPIKVKVPAL